MDGCDILLYRDSRKGKAKTNTKVVAVVVVVVIIVLNIEWLPISFKCRLFSGTALSCLE